MGTKFQLKFPTIQNIVDIIVRLQGKCLIYKIYLQRAFCHLKLHPRYVNKTGIMFNNGYYVYTSVLFGYRHRLVCMQCVTDAIRFIMHKHGFRIFNYIDDMIGCNEPTTAHEAFTFLKQLLQDLGLVICAEK